MIESAPVQYVDPGRLRHIELFADLSDEQLGWLAEVGRPAEVADGTVFAEDGDPGRFLWVLLSGEVLITKSVDGQDQVIARHRASPAADGAGSVPQAGEEPSAARQYFGELPLLAGGGYISTVTAVGPTEVVAYDQETFLELLARCPQVSRILLPVLAWRIRTYEMQAGRTVMMKGLGTLAAGLTHELNNPVTAMVRDARDLLGVLRDLGDAAGRWGGLATPAEQRLVSEISEQLADREAARDPGDPLDAANSADAITDWLAGHDLAAAPEAGITLADHGATPETVQELDEGVRKEVVEAGVRYLCHSLRAQALARDIAEAGNRVGGLVSSIKAYSNLDRAPKQQVDLVQGLEATLSLQVDRMAGVRVHRDYADLPPVSGYPGELNQVWTNLIANAVDAMDGRGDLKVKTQRQGEYAIVEVRDSGPGIAADVLPKLFQPFFTTKDIGQGTGLGLYLSWDIVVHRHRGWIDVTSQPEDTRFSVRLPLRTPDDARNDG